jgi:hypothetical protein
VLKLILHVGTQVKGFSADEDADEQKTIATKKGGMKVREK